MPRDTDRCMHMFRMDSQRAFTMVWGKGQG